MTAPRSKVREFALLRLGRWELDLGLVVLLALGLAVRLVFAERAPVFLEGDSQSYLLPGWELAHGYGFSPELRRAPAYPLFIAAALGLFGDSLDSVALAQHLLGLATVGAAFLIGQRIFGRMAGLLAGFAVAISGTQLIYERYVMTEVLFGFTLILFALVSLAALRQPTVPRLLLAGAALGAAALSRPVAQAVLPLLLFTLLACLPRWRPALQAVSLALAGYLLIIGPWMVRNLVAHETFAASGGLGRSLIARTVKYDNLFDWKWLSETYGGRDDLPARERMLLYRKRGNIPDSRSVRPYQDALTRELGLSPGQADTAMREIALEAIAQHPGEYLKGSLLFTAQLFVGRHEQLQSHWRQRASKDWEEQWDNQLDYLVSPITPRQLDGQSLADFLVELYQPSRLGWLLPALFLLGLVASARLPAGRPGLLLGAVCVALLALSAFLDGPVQRYRYPLDPLISVLAAGGLVGLARELIALARHRPLIVGQRMATPRGQPKVPSPSGRGLG